jgi:hypothetical protein
VRAVEVLGVCFLFLRFFLGLISWSLRRRWR